MSNKKSVFFDANIIFSRNLNHLFMFFCDTGIGVIEPYWSQAVIDEVIKNVKDKTGDDVTERFVHMNAAYPYALVSGYEEVENCEGVDMKDQHVAKASIFNDCDYLVTENIKDFKNSEILKTKPRLVTPDSLLTSIAKKDTKSAFLGVALAWWHKGKKESFDEYLEYLGRKDKGLKLRKFEEQLRSHIAESGQTSNNLADSVLKDQTKRY